MYKSILLTIVLLFNLQQAKAQQTKNQAASSQIKLSGEWFFQIDSLDKGIADRWFDRKLKNRVRLPGSLTLNHIGNNINVNTPWTGSIFDSAWFKKPEYAPYRVKGNIKVPFWLQPVKYYKGPAWYQKQVNIPESWRNKSLELFIERSHWKTSVWIDGKFAGDRNSLSTPDVFDLSRLLPPGKHLLSVRIDNRVLDINVGENSHSISDHTQGNWNGMIGRLVINKKENIQITDVQIFPDINKKQIKVKVQLKNAGGLNNSLNLLASVSNGKGLTLPKVSDIVRIDSANQRLEIIYPMGPKPLLWDEFSPNLYRLKLTLRQKGQVLATRFDDFGMREFVSAGTQFKINGRLTFLRGTLDCAAFPLTGFPPTDISSWLRIFRKCKAYGLNHIRFHSWCPPQAAFEAADREGLYLHIECASWANQGAQIGDGNPLDRFIYDESRRIVSAYGNHPSFCMLAYGNEPAGKNHVKYLTDFVNYWKNRDSRRLYTTGAGWPVITGSDYNSTSDPRIQQWGAGLKSIINAQAPKTDYDWGNIIAKWKQPTVSHEIGQWCVYPDFSEIGKYTGVLKAKNFEIFQDKLNANGLGAYAKDFLNASGKLQALCYKADIEAALRTPGFAGFQLLGLNDFPGQGTALVGVLNAFWGDKGYITGRQYSEFCNSVVPLARFPKMTYINDETLDVPVEIAQFGPGAIHNPLIKWKISTADGKPLTGGIFKQKLIPNGNGIALGRIRQSLTLVKTASRLIVTVQVNKYHNSWDIFVYPKQADVKDSQLTITQLLDDASLEKLKKGGKVLLTLKKGSLKDAYGGDIKIGFSSIFWNTAWTNSQPPTTMGILCNPNHPAFKSFPTQAFSNWQWWDAMSHSNAIMLDAIKPGLKPIVRVIDDWTTARSLGLVFECKVGQGKLIVSGIDLITDSEERPEARQLLKSLQRYMSGPDFNPTVVVAGETIRQLNN